MLQLLNNPVFLALAPVTIVPVVALVVGCIVKLRRDAQQTALKMEMIQRGLTIDEIVAVLEAPDRRRRRWHGEDCVREPNHFVRR